MEIARKAGTLLRERKRKPVCANAEDGPDGDQATEIAAIFSAQAFGVVSEGFPRLPQIFIDFSAKAMEWLDSYP